ncbi:ABC transporter substrate-binding protein [Bradyrhizobium sp. STM 3561]|uniref:ABC transporter substrate-binding protein n=1 Tax=unclassified Bradyrhizobium TaxID=2631580 RepID=UPI00388DFC86
MRIGLMQLVRGGMLLGAIAIGVAHVHAIQAAEQYGPGYTETEIRLGNLMPYSGPVSSLSAIGKTAAAYFEMINKQGGVNHRLIKFISYDDAYSPPKAVEQVRRLVENDDVLALFQSLGTPTNAAIQKYLNAKKIPQLFVATGASRFNDPKAYPWTTGFTPTIEAEAAFYGKFIRETRPDAKVAIIYQNDDSGREAIRGLEIGLEDVGSEKIAARISYEPTDPVMDSQVVRAKASGANVLVAFGTPKAGAQVIRKVAELGWKPLFIVSSSQTNIATVLQPAGLDNAKDIFSITYTKDPTDPTWKDDPDVAEFREFMTKYNPDVDLANPSAVMGYMAAQTMVYVLKQCGDDLSRSNVLKQATTIRDFSPGLLLPGLKVNTSPNNYVGIREFRIEQFDGARWQLRDPRSSPL